MLKFNRKIAMIAALIAGASPAYAGTLSAGPLYLTGQNQADCRFVNLGTATITVTGQAIWQAGSTIPKSSTCSTGKVLGLGQGCDISASIGADHSTSCQVTFTGAAGPVRGALSLSGSGTETDLAADLR
jgi:hypothetical protein